tara:strand:+ start:3350 stop:4102 length:753 start_codon:yes stop_codon:yes gene_type:complete
MNHKELMEVWRRKVIEPSRLEDEERQRLEIDVDAVPGEFKEKDKVSIQVIDDEEADLEEWNKDDDDDYPSRKKKKRDKAMLKPGNNAKTWLHGKEEMDTLSHGIAEKKKKKVKVNCRQHNPYHSATTGEFVDPDKEAGSYSMKGPTPDSQDDCSWGKSSRKQANRSRQAVKQPCGRGAKYRCKDGSEKWEEQLETEGIQQQDAAYMRGILSQELQKALRQQMQGGGCTFAQLVRAMTLWAQAEKGGGKEK